jgi:hypothetical protein
MSASRHPATPSARPSRPARLPILAAAAAAAASLAPVVPARADVVQADWLGGAGSWSTASRWSPAVVPNNTASTSFNVSIDSVSPINHSNVTLDQLVRINKLSLGSDCTLDMLGNALLLDGPTLENFGTISVNNTGIYGGDITFISGPGTILMNGGSALLSPGSSTFTIGQDQTIRGQGSIRHTGERLRSAFVNLGLVDAVRNNSTEPILEFTPTNNGLPVENHGTMQASRSGELFLGTGTYQNANGAIQSLAGGIGQTPDVFIQRNSQITGGTLAARGGAGASLRIDTGCTVSDAMLTAADGASLRIDTGGTLNGSTLSASGGAGLRMLGTTLNNCTFTTSSGGANILLNAGSISPTLTNAANRGLLQLGTPAVGTLSASPANATLVGSMTNDGTIAFTTFGPANQETVTYRGNVMLGGSGTLTMISSAFNNLQNGTADDSLTNGASHTIDGAGNLSGSLVNHGTVNARRIGSSATATIFGDLVNDGTMQAQATTQLDFQNLTSARNDGTIQTVGAGRVEVDGVNWSGTGHWIADGGTVTFAGGNISTTGSIVSCNGGVVQVSTHVEGSSSLALDAGKIIDSANLSSAGSISLRNGSHLLVNSGATLGAGGGVTIESSGGSLELHGANVTAPTISTASGALLVNTSGNSSVLAIEGSGQTSVLAGSLTANYFRQKTLQVSGLATVRPRSASGGGGGTSHVAGLDMNDGTFDLNDNDLIVTSTPKAQVQDAIFYGRNSGDWNGAGITSSAARTHTAHATTLGLLSGSEYKAANGTDFFSGFTVGDTDTLVKYTWYGDTDLNGRVNFDDYVRADNGFNNHLAGWLDGDFDLNGAVNFDDYVLIDLAFNSQSGTLGRALSFLDGSDRSGSGMDAPALQQFKAHLTEFGDAYAGHFASAVPEPVALAFLGVAPLAMARRRWLRHRQ